MLAKFSEVEFERTVFKEKEIVCVVFTYSIKQAREIKKFHVASRATTAKRDARASAVASMRPTEALASVKF